MNVLLLNISILNYNTYHFTVNPAVAKMMNTEWDEQVTYHGQMEPVPRFLVKAFHQTGKKLDQIVVMNTQETIARQNVKIDGKLKTEIAYDFFVRQITQACVDSNIEPPVFNSFVYDEELKRKMTDRRHMVI